MSSMSKWSAFFISLIPLLLLLGYPVEGLSINKPWASFVGIHFHLEVDKLSLLFLYLVGVIVPFVIAAAPPHTFLFYGAILLLQALLIGFFTAQDLALFVIFWEAMLFPIAFLIVGWGEEKKEQAALEFLMYMMTGSALIILATLALYFTAGKTFSFSALASSASLSPYGAVIAAIFFLAFAVKTPLFPFHGWLPKVYTTASPSGSILLAALLSKAGIFGFFRIGHGLFPHFMQAWGPFLLVWAIIGVLYGALAAWKQGDYRRLLAYSSFSHVNFVLVGAFAASAIAQKGALLQAFNHGVTIAALFLLARWLRDRIKSEAIVSHNGVLAVFPRFGWLTLFFVLAAVALPGTNNFIGELLILYGLFLEGPWLAALLSLSIVLSAVYMLSWVQRTYFGAPKGEFFGQDISLKEYVIIAPLAFLVLWVGLYPKTLWNLLP